MNTLFSVLHVASAVFVVGPVAIVPMTALRSLREGKFERAAVAGATTRLLSYLSLIVVVTGFGVMGLADPKYNLSLATPWVLGSLALYAAALILTLVVVVPALRGVAERRSSSSYRPAAIGSGLASVFLIAVVVLMVWKP